MRKMDNSYPSRRDFGRGGFAAAIFATLAGRASAKDAIDTVRIVCPYVPGGSSDALCRKVAAKLVPTYAKSSIVENKSGAAAQVAVAYVKGQPANGATILQAPFVAFSLYPHVYKSLPYDPSKDLIPITTACYFDIALGVGPAVPESVRSATDYLSWVKEDASRNAFGTSGAGTVPHVVGLMLGRNGSVELTHIGYRGAQAGVVDVLGGNLPAIVAPVGDLLQHHKSGRLRMIGVSGLERSVFARDVPTFQELGLADLVHRGYFGFFLPASASAEVIADVNSAMIEALSDKDVVDNLATFGMSATSSTPSDALKLLDDERAKWQRLVQVVPVTADQ